MSPTQSLGMWVFTSNLTVHKLGILAFILSNM
jgi:hypothetical protein